ncbi:MAG: nucleoside phosphorylase [Bacteroidales bacterium]|jgi:uridine phosphorylase|nr:nucleoside phosphorylase [Bacteroidales bacterium]
MIQASEFPQNADGSVYHLHLLPDQLAKTVVLVGDPGRVETFSKHFERIDHKQMNREICTHTGIYKGKPCSILSTGMGTDNLDIVVNELDALVNIDLKTREIKPDKTSLTLVRIGTCGSLQEEIDINKFIASAYGFGIDGLMNFYKPENDVCNRAMETAFLNHAKWLETLPRPYFVKASDELLERVAKHDMYRGITATAQGFYGPQGRVLRLPLAFPQMHEVMKSFEYNGLKITNLEMETSALYGLGQSLGHKTLTACLVVANRVTKKFSENYKQTMENSIENLLDRILEIQ